MLHPHFQAVTHSALAGVLAVAMLQVSPWPAFGTDMSARQVTKILFEADPARPPDFSGLNLQKLDLAALNFKKARLVRADLFGSDLTGADLSGTNLQFARLDRVTLIGSKFDGADLTGASILRPTSFSTLTEQLTESASFVGVKMSDAKVFGQLNGFDFSGADLHNTNFAPFNDTGFIEHIWRTKLESATLSGANLKDANMTYVSARYANFKNADLRNVIFRNADLSHAKFAGADLTNADLTGADLDQSDFRGAKGIETARGLQQAHNRTKARF